MLLYFLSGAMLTLLRIRFYPFSYRSVLPVHTAPDTFEKGMKTMKRSQCSALNKKENVTNWFTDLAIANKYGKNFWDEERKRMSTTKNDLVVQRCKTIISMKVGVQVFLRIL